MKKLLILGASGLVGKALASECANDFDVYGTYFYSSTNLPIDKQFQLDILHEEKIGEILELIEPDIIVSCLRGDFDVQLAFHRNLAEKLQNRNSILYYFSTANVFDGDLSRHHNEGDIPISESDYGNFKINCEKTLIQLLGKRANIIRIPGIWGKDSPRLNDLKKHLDNAASINVYSNLECNFLLDKHLAIQMRFIMENELSGIFHLGSVDMVKQDAFYIEIANRLIAEKTNIHSALYEDKEETHYFGLVSIRDDLPDSIKSTNKDIISYLC